MFGVERGEVEEDEAEEEREGGERMGLRCWPLRFSRRLMSRPLKWPLIYKWQRRDENEKVVFCGAGCSLSKNFFSQRDMQNQFRQ